MDKPLWGLRVDGPSGRRFLRGLSLTRLWREGCGGAPLNLWKAPVCIKPLQPPCGRWKCIPLLVAGALWTSPAGLRVDGPLGRRFLRGLSLTRLWLEGCGGAPLNLWKAPSYEKTIQPPCGRRKCFPPCPLRGTSPASGGRITRAYCSGTYERIALRSFIVPLLRGGKVVP